jgi:hypothetical protein
MSYETKLLPYVIRNQIVTLCRMKQNCYPMSYETKLLPYVV